MSADPAVSVIIIAYQAERFLAEAIDSVLAQTCADYELLIADAQLADQLPGVDVTLQLSK